MSAVCAVRASCLRMGSARDEISADRRSWFGYCRTFSPVIFPVDVTVIATWTFPNSLGMVAPVMVRVVAAAFVGVGFGVGATVGLGAAFVGFGVGATVAFTFAFALALALVGAGVGDVVG